MIKRDIEKNIKYFIDEYECTILVGPRGVGKTTMLLQLAEEDREYITLDDFEARKMAINEPEMFLQIHDGPVIIEEIQYAPELLKCIFSEIENGTSMARFWLTSSQTYSISEYLEKCDVEKVLIARISSLSQHELYGAGENEPFIVDPVLLKDRSDYIKECTISELYERIWRGSLPYSHTDNCINPERYYAEYIRNYIENDICENIKGVDKLLFQEFIRAAACRISRILNIHEIALDVGISDDTAKRWLKIMEKTGMIFLIYPYQDQVLRRTIKTPKIYFFDTGLVAYLSKYQTAQILEAGAMNNAVFENYVISEIRKSYLNALEEPEMWYYRDKDNKEIDLVMNSDGLLVPVNIRKTIHPDNEIFKPFSVFRRCEAETGEGAVICLKKELSALSADNYIIPVWMI